MTNQIDASVEINKISSGKPSSLSLDLKTVNPLELFKVVGTLRAIFFVLIYNSLGVVKLQNNCVKQNVIKDIHFLLISKFSFFYYSIIKDLLAQWDLVY